MAARGVAFGGLLISGAFCRLAFDLKSVFSRNCIADLSNGLYFCKTLRSLCWAYAAVIAGKLI